MINEFIDWAKKEGWVVELSDTELDIPECVRERYNIIPEQWLSFISHFKRVSNVEDNIWFLTLFNNLDNFFYYESISLDAASGDDEWTNEIKAFWDNTFVIMMSVVGDYHYYGIDIESGKVVEGWEPEFEEPEVIADSFDEFIEKIIKGEIDMTE